ncbi:MAG: hypothetical protein KatS3mg127_1875 [Silanimonas sp.]|nr:MAG: hypothetical protein KatS3mg127_1875 [Silanimonas sp.]
MQDSGSATRILVAEDDNGIRAVLKATLRSAGYVVYEARNGSEALGLAIEHLPDLILSDVLMPGGDGQTLLAALRADPRTSELPFVFLTGLDERQAVRDGMNLGADDYLTKPFRPTELLSLVQAQLRRSAKRIEARRQLEAEAQKLREFDSITGLPNRGHFLGRILHEQSEHPGHALASIALGQLPVLRQSLGQAPADAVMREAANRLLDSARQHLGSEALLARSGEHRFALSLRGEQDEARIEARLREVLAPLAEPMEVGGRRLFLDASVGVTVSPRDGDSPEVLLDHAETAEPATAPGGTVAFYSAENSAVRGRRVRLLQDLRIALERGELSLAYQPQVALAGERLVGFEALLRWYHPELGQVAPAEFIPLAEESGLILSIGSWVLAEAVRQLGGWQAEGLAVPRVAVNLSPRQFEDPGLLDGVRAVLAGSGLPPGSLELEVTESAALLDPERAIGLMARLREMGVALALDDFGTGYSNLSQLKRLPVDVLKIDQLFVRQIVRDAGDAAIVRAVVALGPRLRSQGGGRGRGGAGAGDQARAARLRHLPGLPLRSATGGQCSGRMDARARLRLRRRAVAQPAYPVAEVLSLVAAEVAYRAGAAQRLSCLAGVAPVQDQPVVGVLLELGWHHLQQFFLHRVHGLARGEAGAVGDAEDVCVHRDGRFAKSSVQYHVGGLAAHAGQGLQRFAVARYLAAVSFQQQSAGGDQVRCLGVVKTDGVDVGLQAGLAEGEDAGRRIGHREQSARGLVHAHVGGLRREHHRHQQLEGRAVFQLGGGLRVQFAQAAEELVAVGGLHAVWSAGRGRGARRLVCQYWRRAMSRASSRKAPTGSTASKKPR